MMRPQAAASSRPNGPKKARMFMFTSQLRHPETGEELVCLDRLRSGLRLKSTGLYVWHIEDQDDAAAHLQGCLKMENSRPAAQVARWLGLPVDLVVPLRGRGAFEGYIRYLLGESPEAVAKGKAHYADAGMESNFDFRSLLEEYFGHQEAVVRPLTLNQIKIAVYRGEMTLDEVQVSHVAIWVNHHKRLEHLAETGATQRSMAAAAAELERARERREARAAAERARRAYLAEQGFGESEIDLAISAGLSEDDLLERRRAAERAAAEEAERLRRAEEKRREHEERERLERESPEYQERLRLEAEAKELQQLIDMIAIWFEIPGRAAARTARVRAKAVENGFIAAGEEMTIQAARTFACDIYEYDEDDIEEDIAGHERDLASLSLSISTAERHAAEGIKEGFDKAMRLRQQFCVYPDLVSLPPVRTDLPKAMRDKLQNVSG